MLPVCCEIKGSRQHLAAFPAYAPAPGTWEPTLGDVSLTPGISTWLPIKAISLSYSWRGQAWVLWTSLPFWATSPKPLGPLALTEGLWRDTSQQ